MADISAKLVKELRDKTGAGMMDCKKALAESDSDVEKAMEWLRQKGITSAGKKAGKVTAEGLVGSYIHTGGRVGVLVEINCQTDFVARNEAFQVLVRDIAMQIAACPNVEYVRVEDIPPDVVIKEKEIEMGKDDLSNKPVNIREKIVEGRIDKRLKELSLLDQQYIKDQSITVAELVKQKVASLGENIQVRRFVRFVMGEGIEKQEEDFAAEVAAQTAVKEAAPIEVPVEVPVEATVEATVEEAAVEEATVEATTVEAVIEEAPVEATPVEEVMEEAPVKATVEEVPKSAEVAKSEKKSKKSKK